MENKKKLTNGQLQRRLERSLIHIDRTKGTNEVYFSDKGLRLTTNEEYCIISTGFHRHIFDAFNAAQGISRPYLYTRRIVEIANEHLEDCKTENGYSFAKLLETLRAKEDRTEYNICVYYDWFVFNCFQPLYSISEDEVSQFLVYESYIRNIARNSVLLSEKTEDMTNKQFLEKEDEEFRKLIEDMDERVLFEKKTDEEVAKENVEAMQKEILDEQAQQ